MNIAVASETGTVVVAAEDLFDHVAVAEYIETHASEPERIHEVVALFGNVGLGRKFVGTVAAVLGIIGLVSHALGAAASGFRFSKGVMFASALYCLAWYIAGRALFNWGKGAQRRSELQKQLAATKSPAEKEKIQKQLDKLQTAHEMAAQLKRSKVLDNPKVKEGLAKKDPAKARAVMNGINDIA